MHNPGEYALLRFWDFSKELLAEQRADSERLGCILSELIDLHLKVWDESIGMKVLPHAGQRHALSAAIRTASPVDVNLKLFDMLGRIALHGLWLVWADHRYGGDLLPGRSKGYNQYISKVADNLWAMVAANPALLTPVADEQVVDISLAFILLATEGRHRADLAAWTAEIVGRSDFAYRTQGRHPCVLREYADLAEHPRKGKDGYFEEVTQGSVLLPTLALWSAVFGDTKTLDTLAQLKTDILDHCAAQLWFPDEESEELLWRSQDGHGAALLDIPISKEPHEILDYVRRECGPNTPFAKLSAIQ